MQSHDSLEIMDLEEEVVPAGAMGETKADAIHWITVLVLGWYPN